MSFTESLRIALNSLVINRLRAALTTLGIVIGVGAVVALVSLGNGVQRYITNQFSRLGTTTVTVNSRNPTNKESRAAVQPLTGGDADAIDDPANVPDVDLVAATYSVNATVRANGQSVSLRVTGVTPNYAAVNSYTMAIGAFISQEDVDADARVAVLGQGTVSDLWGSTSYNPVGLDVQINGRMFTVAGVIAPTGSTFGTDEFVFVPLSTAQSRLANARVQGGEYQVSQIQAMAVSQDDVQAAIAQIQKYLTDAHNILYPGDEDFSVNSPANLLDSITQITGLLTIFLGIVAGISLLVGGIGIMNIMLVSVTERTREIGLRKAVGARGQDILTQFLIESLVLSFVGGMIGIGVGFVVMLIGNRVVPTLGLYLTPQSILLATVVCTLIGVFFGLLPASRAARMRPIDALRYE